ncbi:M14 family zinc carboxypeptidase [Aurantiacibacter spongiae]|uniref:Carboxypeptidase n=1 Tax=Aurantiacibacter spongiae TaxID=2488860 RepID=A0A3N5CQP9_9SPHN|nr:M14 family zinc carboxypeptidase [Aurantiacibacter spongiae]RPF70736.1 carboxypeptidase [Aurantiacibacter spongiae]
MLRLLSGLLACLLCLAPPAAAQDGLLEGPYDPAIPTLEQVSGYAPGEQISRPDAILAYMRALEQAAPGRMRIVQYAVSWEGRPLIYAIVTSAANMARIDAIKADMQRIANGGAPDADSLPVTWLSYGVHGDEISSSDAALALAYHLLAAEGDPAVDTILANSVVIIDPSQNPDGRARFVNSYYQQLGLAPSGDRYTAGHDQPWPGGRFNHYLFDLNRDWFALTQPETRGKVAAVSEWHPVVYVDAHEMGGDDSYFFPPNAEPFSPFITPAQRARQDMLGRANAARLDALGVPYFTREIFDAFYPGYGDTWPTLNGAIGMTFEQSSARGLVWDRSDGGVLTYGEGVRNHFATSLATAETVARNAASFLSDYAAYRTGARDSGAFVIDLGQRRWNAEALGRRLAAQGIRVGRVAGAARACGRSYPAGYLSVGLDQPQGRLIRSLLDTDVELPADFIAGQETRRANDLPHEIYDTTAWSVGLMSGLDVRQCGSAGSGQALAPDAAIPALARPAGAFGLAVPWTDSGQVQLVACALRAGLKGRATDTVFTADGRDFGRGTVVFTNADNDGDLSALVALARDIGAETVPLASGWVDSGPNLGSDSFRLLGAPRVAMLWDEGISPVSAGATRYVLEQRFGLPVAPIRTGTVGRASLRDFDVVIMPEGAPAAALGDGGRAALARFVRDGGVLLAYGGSLAMLASGEDALFATRPETVLGGEATGPESDAGDGAEGDTAPGVALESEADYRAAILDDSRRPDTLPGALLNTLADGESFLAAGYSETGPTVFADGSLILTPLTLTDGTNVIRYAGPDNLVASGYVWDENRRQMAFKPYMIAQATGTGLAIGFAQDPAVRGYLDGLDLLLANAVIVAPARVR